MPASTSVTVTTTARLHFGFLDPSGRSAEPFGSLGLSLEWPRTRLTLRRADAFDVSGPESERAARHLQTLAASYGLDGAYSLVMEQAIQPHAGLGSGTQLALAVGAALATLEGLDLSPEDIAAKLGRGARSGIGIATFEAGGVVLDSGPRDGALPRLVARLPFPETWRVLLVFDPKVAGLAGSNEAAAFVGLPDFPESETAELRARIAETALPALARGDFATFAAEIDYLQQVMGVYFAPRQGGIYTSPAVADLLDTLSAEGVTGLGQSSWGPTGFVFAESEAAAETLLDAARRLNTHDRLHFELVRGRNEGARIEAEPAGIY